jgi:hypothetical protein
MEITIVNYTGISLVIQYEKSLVNLSCGTDTTIEITKKSAKFTRFYARYKSAASAKIQISGRISILLDNADYNPILVLGAFLANKPVCIYCININENGRYIYTEVPQSAINELYKEPKYYNLPIVLKYEGSAKEKLRVVYNILFSKSYCANRDGLTCDKFAGVPVFIWLLLIIVLCLVSVAIVIYLQVFHREGGIKK